MGDELKVELGCLNRCFPLIIGDKLIAEKGQQGGNQQREHRHDQNNATFYSRFSARGYPP
ncbi:hypothetical protein D3C73_869610 [compost metagenome]